MGVKVSQFFQDVANQSLVARGIEVGGWEDSRILNWAEHRNIAWDSDFREWIDIHPQIFDQQDEARSYFWAYCGVCNDLEAHLKGENIF